jgi:hypothetical protein
VPTLEQLMRDLPNVMAHASHLDRLAQRLARWRTP